MPVTRFGVFEFRKMKHGVRLQSPKFHFLEYDFQGGQ